MIIPTMNVQLNEACRQQHQAVIDKGFESNMEQLPRLLMLTVSELAEALEADRKGRRADMAGFKLEYNEALEDWSGCVNKEQVAFRQAFESTIKDTLEDELADAFLRLMDICGIEGIDIETHIIMKARYNATREQKHGKKY